jgi:hypothetical protein
MCPVDKDGDIRMSSRETTPDIPLQLNLTVENVEDMSLVEPNAAIELQAPTDKPPPKDPMQEREEGIEKGGVNEIDTVKL